MLWYNCQKNWKWLIAPFLWYFFNSPAFINKLFEDGTYAIETVRPNWKLTPKLNEDKKTSKSQSDFHYSENIICYKWYDKKPVLYLKTIVGVGASKVMKLTKSSATKTPTSCPKIIKIYSNGMAGLRFDRKIKYRFYLKMFFNLIDGTLKKSYCWRKTS